MSQVIRANKTSAVNTVVLANLGLVCLQVLNECLKFQFGTKLKDSVSAYLT